MVVSAGLILSCHLKQVREAFSIACNSILILFILKGDLSELRILYELVGIEVVSTLPTSLLIRLHSHHRFILSVALETLNISGIIADCRRL